MAFAKHQVVRLSISHQSFNKILDTESSIIIVHIVQKCPVLLDPPAFTGFTSQRFNEIWTLTLLGSVMWFLTRRNHTKSSPGCTNQISEQGTLHMGVTPCAHYEQTHSY